jgi:hypothetical protein
MTITNQGSATIHQFPARGRYAAGTERSDVKLPVGAKIAVGGAWYHDAAIESDGKQTR